jgi:hypothetical protein
LERIAWKAKINYSKNNIITTAEIFILAKRLTQIDQLIIECKNETTNSTIYYQKLRVKNEKKRFFIQNKPN